MEKTRVLVETVKEPQEVEAGGRRWGLLLLLQHVSAGLWLPGIRSDSRGVEGWWELEAPWLKLWLLQL